MLLLVDAFAVLVQRTIQSFLFTLGQMTTMLGLIDAFAFRDVRVVRFVVCGLRAAGIQNVSKLHALTQSNASVPSGM